MSKIYDRLKSLLSKKISDNSSNSEELPKCPDEELETICKSKSLLQKTQDSIREIWLLCVENIQINTIKLTYMKAIKNTNSFYVLGVKFENIQEAIEYAINERAKNGVYVGEDAELYPCFDSEDYASEDRFFWNIVFARSKEELTRKLVKLKSIPPQVNYNKFSEAFAPMIYWGGDSIYDVIATEDIE